MTLDIAQSRLRNQRLSGGRFARPEDVVRWLGAVQAQEYADTKWALALRSRRTTDDAIERALTKGAILAHTSCGRRGIWSRPRTSDGCSRSPGRVSARGCRRHNRHLELDAGVFRRSQSAIVRALRAAPSSRGRN